MRDIPPSKIKWNDIYSKDTVSEKEPYEFLLKCTDMKKDLPAALDAPSDTLSEMQKMILDNGIADLESFSSMFFGNIIAFLKNSLQSKTGKPGTYKFRVTPVVFCHPEDHRKNKYSDYIVLRLINKSVKVVVAIKKRVTPTVISAKSTHIAQLLHEVYLSERGQCVIAIYGNCFHSHVFVLDVGRKPYLLLRYCSVPSEKIVSLGQLLLHLLNQYECYK